MQYIHKIIKGLTTVSRWGALATIFLMMLLITFSVISRGVFKVPIIGDYELVQLMMVSLVGLGFAHSEAIDAHIKVGLIVDRFNTKVQLIIDFFVYILVTAICFFVGTILIKAGLKALSTFLVTTSLLHIPHYPFQILLGIGFYMWGLEAILKLIFKIGTLISGKGIQKERRNFDVS